MPTFVLFAVLAACWWVFIQPHQDQSPEDTTGQWDIARAGMTSPIDRALYAAAKPLQGNAALYGRATSPAYRNIQAKLLASGGMYGGSVEVFLALQFAALFVGAVILSVAMSIDLSNAQALAVIGTGVAIAGWPVSMVNKSAKERTAEINQTLPGFADLLQMPLAAGDGVLPAIAFTVERIKPGVVRTEVENMLALQKSRAVPDAQVFMVAGERLGTPEAKSFFTALMQAHTQGMKVIENIESQADALRSKAFELRLADIRKIETTITAKIAVHFMPGLLIITMYPVIYGFSQA